MTKSADFAERIRFSAALLKATLEKHRMKELATLIDRCPRDIARWRCVAGAVSRRSIVAGAIVAAALLPFRRALLFLCGGRVLRFCFHTPAAWTCSHA